jgi:hypothetical protein
MASLRDLVRNILPEQETVLRVESVEEGDSKAGKPKLTFQATVVQGPEKGKGIIWSRSLQPNSLWKLAGELLKAGFDTEVGDEPTKFPAVLSEIAAGMEKQTYNAQISVVTNAQTGDKFNDVEILSPFDRIATERPAVAAGPRRVSASEI